MDYTTNNLIGVISKLKKKADNFMDDERIPAYQTVLMTQFQSKKKKKGSSGSNEEKVDESAQQKQMRQAKEKFQNRIVEELDQPYKYRDQIMILSENLIIFNDFYNSIWNKISLIGLAIHLINVGSNQNAKICTPNQVLKPE